MSGTEISNEPQRGRLKQDFERLLGVKCGYLDYRLGDDGMYLDRRVRELYTAFKIGTRNVPSRPVVDGDGVQTILAHIDERNVPRLVRAYDYRNSALRVAKHMAAENRDERYGVYSLHTLVFNPNPKLEVADAA